MRMIAALLALLLAGSAAADGINISGPSYLFGPWTPTIISGGGGTPTYSAQTGFYEQFGREVTVRFTVTLATAGTLAAGVVSIGGLPITAVGTGTCWVSSYSVTGLSALTYGVTGTISDATTSINLVSNGNAVSTSVTVAQIGATPFFVGTCSYKAS